tara:strand:- start:180 stop:1349 length:1170 start_codon:yes stop_codon:yes gene_type:complete
MSYIGSKPADAVLETDDITDGVITTSKLADNSVTTAKTSYQDAPFRNIIINGDMSIAQRGTSVSSLTNSGYRTCDRWRITLTSFGTWTASQDTDVPTGQGFAKSLKMDCTTANGSLSSNSIGIIEQRFEGQNLQYLKKGTSSAVSTTVSFWVKSTKTGTFICELDDNDNTRNINKSYTISSSDTWEKKTITFDGDTTGALGNDNGYSFRLLWWLGAGTDLSSGTLQTSWGSTVNANRAVGQANIADSTSNNFYITGVQWEAGTTASDFEFLPVDVNLQRCQRYYYLVASGSGIAISLGTMYGASELFGILYLPTKMRAVPTISQVTGSNYYKFYRSGSTDEFNSLAINFTANSQIVNIHNGLQVSGTSGDAGMITTNNSTSFVAVTSEL